MILMHLKLTSTNLVNFEIFVIICGFYFIFTKVKKSLIFLKNNTDMYISFSIPYNIYTLLICI